MAPGNRRLLLIAEPSSYRIAAFLKGASRLGLDVLIASRGAYSLVSEVHDGLHIDLADHESALKTILYQSRVMPFHGVLGIDDSTVELAAKVAEKIDLPHNPPYAAKLTRRKDLARAHLAKAGCPVPRHWLVSLDRPLAPQFDEINFPCVVKPLTLSASRGVIRANNQKELALACKRIESILAGISDPFEKRHLLVEKYINGSEVAYEGYLRHGELTTLVIFDKPIPLTGPYFEETIYVTPSMLPPDLQAAIREQVAIACGAYGLTTGPVHAELRIDNSKVWILEVAARTIGGDCARSLDNEDGSNLEQLAISLVMDQDYKIEPPRKARGVMMIPVKERGILRRVEGLSDAVKVKNIDEIDIVIRTGNELIPLPEGNQYPGYIFARGNTPEDVVTALEQAYKKLNFVVAPIFSTQVT